jgi:phosphoketolase
MKRLFKQFSFPGGIPSHMAPETPGSINECGELGYVLSMLMVQYSIILTSLLVASSEMEKLKLVHWQQAGIRIR